MNLLQQYFIDVLKKDYFNFKGKATRTQYWLFYLFFFITMTIAGVIASFTAPIIASLVQLALLLPILGITVRRYHDCDFRGWWFFCPIVNFVLLFIPSAQTTRFDAGVLD